MSSTTNYYRYKIILEYIGTNFVGWQSQGRGNSIQEILEAAIWAFAGERVIVYGAGRTDAGVHAIGQVAHFDLVKYMLPNKLLSSLNHFIKPWIAVIHCELVSENFHARFSAKNRYYLYKIINRPGNIALEFGRAWLIHRPLDVTKMRQAASCLIGKHDFSAFRSKFCQASSALRTLSEINIIENDRELGLYFKAPSFLHNMVRNIVGSLALVGLGKLSLEEIKKTLTTKVKYKIQLRAPACGLYFLKVDF